MLFWVGKLEGPGDRTRINWLEFIYLWIFIPFIFLCRAAIIFLLNIRRIMTCVTLNNVWIAARNLDCAIDNLKMQVSEWFWLLFWRVWWWNPVVFTWRMIFYGIFNAIFGVPIIFWTFYKSVYEFGPEHIPKRSFCDILKQPVPSESDFDNNKVKWRSGARCRISRQVFRARPLSRKIARNKKIQDKRVYKERNWQSWAGQVNNGPTNHMPPLASKYCTWSYYHSSQVSMLGAG